MKMLSMCLGKRFYRNEEHALKVAAKVFKDRQVKLRVYACPYCGNYHLTKQDSSIG